MNIEAKPNFNLQMRSLTTVPKDSEDNLPLIRTKTNYKKILKSKLNTKKSNVNINKITTYNIHSSPSKINTHFEFTKDRPVKMKLQKLQEENQENVFKIKSIVDHYKVFQNEENNLYRHQYMAKIFKLLSKNEKDYFVKRKSIEPILNLYNKQNNSDEIYLTSSQRNLSKINLNLIEIDNSRKFGNLQNNLIAESQYENFETEIMLKDSFDFDSSNSEEENFKTSRKKKLLDNLKSNYDFYELTKEKKKNNTTKSYSCNFIRPLNFENKINSNYSTPKSKNIHFGSDYSEISQDKLKNTKTYLSSKFIGKTFESNQKSNKNLQKENVLSYKKNFPHKYFLSAFVSSKNNTKLSNNKKIVFGTTITPSSNINKPNINDNSQPDVINIKKGFKRKEKLDGMEKFVAKFKRELNYNNINIYHNNKTSHN